MDPCESNSPKCLMKVAGGSNMPPVFGQRLGHAPLGRWGNERTTSQRSFWFSHGPVAQKLNLFILGPFWATDYILLLYTFNVA